MTQSELIRLLQNATKKLRKQPVDDPRFTGDSDDAVNDGVLAGLTSYLSAPASPHFNEALADALREYMNAWNEEEVNKPG